MYASANPVQFTLQIPAVHNDFKVLAFDGREAISCLYAIHVEVVSHYRDFDLESLLGEPAFLQFGHNGEGLHGCIENVVAGEADNRLIRYHLTLVPFLHYLQFSTNQRIFQKLTVPDIITQVLKGHRILADVFTFNLRNSLEREYCTQYGETDFEFIQRLCAEEGIAWHHRHSPQDHMLVFSEASDGFATTGATAYMPDSGMVRDEPVVNQFSVRLNTRTSKTTRRDYNFTRPDLLREGYSRVKTVRELEDYRYPAPIQNDKRGMQLALHALERHRADAQLAEGQSDQPTQRSGHFFTLTNHPRKAYNDLWLLLSVQHYGKQPQALEESAPGHLSSEDGFTQGYRNTFSAIPWDIVYRPPLQPRKAVLVSQTARVTGPAGEEIFCDEHGRVKVEFHWDRAALKSNKSSCWLRVASGWAGERFGSVTIPRVGMEVVVTYLEGDPDKPLITGCVTNGRNQAPYPLPANKTRTVLRSHSSPHTGGYNELLIEDRASQEKISLRAQRDFDALILNDSASQIGNDLTSQVGRNSASLIKGDELHTTHGLRNTVIGGNEMLSVTGSTSMTSGGTLVIQAGDQAHVTATNVVISAGMSLTLQAGGHHLVIGPAGIFSSVAIQPGGAPAAGAAALTLPGMPEVALTPAALALPTLPFFQQQAVAGALLPVPGCQFDASGECPVHPSGIAS